MHCSDGLWQPNDLTPYPYYTWMNCIDSTRVEDSLCHLFRLDSVEQYDLLSKHLYTFDLAVLVCSPTNDCNAGNDQTSQVSITTRGVYDARHLLFFVVNRWLLGGGDRGDSIGVAFLYWLMSIAQSLYFHI